MTKRDYYEILGVSRSAGEDEIKQAYRNLARRHHPDVAHNKTDAEHHFKEINEAFAVLSNPEKRAQYDRFGHAAFDFSGAGAPGGFNFGFASGFDLFDDLLGSFFGADRTAGGQSQHFRGRDIRVDLEMTLEEAFQGIRREVSVKGAIRCETCQGTGAKGDGYETCKHCRGAGKIEEVQQSFFGRIVRQTACPICEGTGKILKNPCKTCRGSGLTEGQRKITIQVPAGVDDGNRIRIRQEGEAGLRGSASGDLYAFIHVKPHSHFQREDNNILYPLRISFPEAALGNDVEVPTLSGKEKIQIPPGSHTGDVIRLRGKGMPSVNSRSHGDQFIVLSVDVPKKLNPKQKELLQEFAKESGIQMNPNKGLFHRMKDALSDE